MDSSESQPRDKLNPFEHLHAQADDAPRAYRRHSSSAARTWRRIFVPLLVVVAAGYLLVHFSDLLSSTVSRVTVHHNTASTLPVSSNPVPPIYTQDALIEPKPLADCIKPDNIIDEAVATCRYGQFPRATENPDARGMVSASYSESQTAGRSTGSREDRENPGRRQSQAG